MIRAKDIWLVHRQLEKMMTVHDGLPTDLETMSKAERAESRKLLDKLIAAGVSADEVSDAAETLEIFADLAEMGEP